jgi:hypothetical protein
MKKLTILALVVFLFAGVVKAQLRYGIKGGANITDILTYSSIIDDVDMVAHFQIGIIAQYKYGNFAIQPELLYSEKGGVLKDVYSDGNSGSSYLTSYADLSDAKQDIHFTSQNIELPINLQYGQMFGKTNVYVQAGPYVSFMLGGRINGDNDTYKSVNDEFKFQKFEFGLGAGAGVEFGKYQVSAKYDFGLTHVGKKTLNYNDTNINPFYEMRNRNLSVSLAYIF